MKDRFYLKLSWRPYHRICRTAEECKKNLIFQNTFFERLILLEIIPNTEPKGVHRNDKKTHILNINSSKERWFSPKFLKKSVSVRLRRKDNKKLKPEVSKTFFIER